MLLDQDLPRMSPQPARRSRQSPDRTRRGSASRGDRDAELARRHSRRTEVSPRSAP